jgi:hypothetical protein
LIFKIYIKKKIKKESCLNNYGKKKNTIVKKFILFIHHLMIHNQNCPHHHRHFS